MKNQRITLGSAITHTVAACLVLAALGLATAELLGAGSGRGSPPTDINFTATLPGICGFDVQSTVIGKSGVISLPGGDFLVTAPATFNTFTNLSDPTKSVTLNITGPAKVTTDQNGNFIINGLGRGVAFGPSFGIWLFIGNWNVVIDANTGYLLGQPTGTGQIINVCELIN